MTGLRLLGAVVIGALRAEIHHTHISTVIARLDRAIQ
jgi:hypothetical protein